MEIYVFYIDLNNFRFTMEFMVKLILRTKSTKEF